MQDYSRQSISPFALYILSRIRPLWDRNRAANVERQYTCRPIYCPGLDPSTLKLHIFSFPQKFLAPFLLYSPQNKTPLERKTIVDSQLVLSLYIYCPGLDPWGV